MNDSSGVSVIRALKSDHQHSGKGHKIHSTNVAKTKAVQRIDEDTSAQVIQRAWLSHVDKVIFQLLKHAVCAAAVVDACKIMGEKKFYGQIIEDERLFQRFKITDEIDIVTMQDYMQYSSLLDETPARSGGRNNCWRRLSLENFPRTMIMYDIVDYAESGVISNRLQKELKYLLQKPQTEAMHQHQLQIVSEVRCSSPSSNISPLYQTSKQKSQIKHLGRRSKKALLKVEKMRKAYKMNKEKNASVVTEPQKDASSTKKQTIIISTSDFDIVKVQESVSDEEMEEEQKELFAWSQELCITTNPSSF
ncbi:uncharacterized protein CXorf58 homolog isoform X3 [Tamandua tetradactyla]|uniref:uncharacterized protein CXorf58 homolog isoform X3 n=1 Tax=Tamandua tetradactyla TaxID=48850 RepID=UPI0040548EAD